MLIKFAKDSTFHISNAAEMIKHGVFAFMKFSSDVSYF